ncbi:MAG: hypothetical protein HQL78_08840 [Magnetococcales bacterium]|nr:hypothetical protein [Magnetococcales bacterium]
MMLKRKPLATPDAPELSRFKTFLKERSGLIFVGNRERLLVTGLLERAQATRIASWENYRQRLEQDAKELDKLITLLTVNESYFFRESDQLRLLSQHLIPEFRRRAGNAPVRIISAGCSSGDEPYSIAMEMVRSLGKEALPTFEVMGCDIDQGILDRAREGIYNDYSFRGVDPEIRNRFFKALGPDRFQVMDEIRRRVTFYQVNLAGGSFPDVLRRVDCIFYRNVSIYFDKPTQRHIFNHLAGLLKPGGALIVSATEIFTHTSFLDGMGHGLVRDEWNNILFFRKSRPGEGRTATQTGLFSSTLRHDKPPTITAPPARVATPVPSVSAASAKVAVAAVLSGVGSWEQARQLALEKRYEQALKMLDGLLAASASSQDSLRALGLGGCIFLHVRRLTEARNHCLRMQKLDPMSVESHLLLGLADRQDGNHDGVITHCRKAAYADPQIWTAHFYMAESLSAVGSQPLARQGFQTAANRIERFGLARTGLSFFPLDLTGEEMIQLCRRRMEQPDNAGRYRI